MTTNALVQDLQAAWSVLKPLIAPLAAAAEPQIDGAIQTLDKAVNGGIDAELAKALPAPIEPVVAAVINEGLGLVEAAARKLVDGKLAVIATARHAVAA